MTKREKDSRGVLTGGDFLPGARNCDRPVDRARECEILTKYDAGPPSTSFYGLAQMVRRERLDQFVVFGEDHLRHLGCEYTTYHNRCRPDQDLGNRALSGEPPPEGTGPVPDVVCEERLGRLVRHYMRQAA